MPQVNLPEDGVFLVSRSPSTHTLTLSAGGQRTVVAGVSKETLRMISNALVSAIGEPPKATKAKQPKEE